MNCACKYNSFTESQYSERKKKKEKYIYIYIYIFQIEKQRCFNIRSRDLIYILVYYKCISASTSIFKDGTRIRTRGPKLKTKFFFMKIKITFISYSTKYYIQNKYFLNISYYKTHQQSKTYKISVSYFVRNFCLVHIFFCFFCFCS